MSVGQWISSRDTRQIRMNSKKTFFFGKIRIRFLRLWACFSSTLSRSSIYRVSFVSGPSPGLRQHEPRHGKPPQTEWKKKKACLHFTPRAHQQVTWPQAKIILLQTENIRWFTSHTEILQSSHTGVRNNCVLYNHTPAHPHKDDALIF